MPAEVTAPVATVTTPVVAAPAPTVTVATLTQIPDEPTPLEPAAPADQNDSAVQGANREIADEEVPLAVMSDDTNNDIVEIQDEESPLAAGFDKNGKRHWWWWILLVIAAITGKTAYDKKNKKGIFAEKAVAGSNEESEDTEE